MRQSDPHSSLGRTVGNTFTHVFVRADVFGRDLSVWVGLLEMPEGHFDWIDPNRIQTIQIGSDGSGLKLNLGCGSAGLATAHGRVTHHVCGRECFSTDAHSEP
jgi:hypothetical protein